MNLTLGSYPRLFWPLLMAAALGAQTSQVLETKTITPPEEPYAGWSTLARRANGELWVTWSGGRDGHICPLGQVKANSSPICSEQDSHKWKRRESYSLIATFTKSEPLKTTPVGRWISFGKVTYNLNR
jgi:hypothetical protein